jgi:hypothetical protein
MAENSLKIYIAGPYSAREAEPRLANVLAAIDKALAILKKGHIPFVPHLTHFVDERALAKGIRLEWADYIRWDLEWLYECDALLYTGHSPGAQLEREVAQILGKKIFEDISEIPQLETTSTIREWRQLLSTLMSRASPTPINEDQAREVARRLVLFLEAESREGGKAGVRRQG